MVGTRTPARPCALTFRWRSPVPLEGRILCKGAWTRGASRASVSVPLSVSVSAVLARSGVRRRVAGELGARFARGDLQQLLSLEASSRGRGGELFCEPCSRGPMRRWWWTARDGRLESERQMSHSLEAGLAPGLPPMRLRRARYSARDVPLVRHVVASRTEDMRLRWRRAAVSLPSTVSG